MELLTGAAPGLRTTPEPNHWEKDENVSMQRERLRNPYPFTWEIPTLALCVLVVVLVLAAHTGRALAILTTGGAVTFPALDEVFTSLPALLRGDAAAGLTSPPTPPPGPTLLLAWIVTWEAFVLTACTSLGAFAVTRWGPARLRGMATRAEAEHTLGLARLRAARTLIRPDLHPRKEKHS